MNKFQHGAICNLRHNELTFTGIIFALQCNKTYKNEATKEFTGLITN